MCRADESGDDVSPPRLIASTKAVAILVVAVAVNLGTAGETSAQTLRHRTVSGRLGHLARLEHSCQRLEEEAVLLGCANRDPDRVVRAEGSERAYDRALA